MILSLILLKLMSRVVIFLQDRTGISCPVLELCVAARKNLGQGNYCQGSKNSRPVLCLPPDQGSANHTTCIRDGDPWINSGATLQKPIHMEEAVKP